MPLYPCGEEGCDECDRAFGPAQAAAVKRKNAVYRAAAAMTFDPAPLRDEYPDNGLTDPWQTSGPGTAHGEAA